MKTFIIITLLIAIAAILGFRSYNKANKAVNISNTPKDFYSISYVDINGKEVQMSEYKGKYVLCVNVASKCGLTPQYEKLQTLYDKHKDKLVIIGFPCNQFLGQEPEGEAKIAEFCSKNYGVTFPLSSKISVKGKEQHPLYTWLTSKELNGVGEDDVEWNFHKFLVSPEGTWLATFSSKSDPLSGEIEKYLK
jgi:glutathione peroxidase